ncbi:MAG: molybdopterin-dependent oxidoreductase [Candidatus Bathyarchaeia archaeon]
MVEENVVKTDCAMCYHSCGLNVYVKDGKIVRVEGMPEHPLNQGEICPRAEAIPSFVYAPDRLKYPMEKTENGWRRITWDEALNKIAAKLTEMKEKYGPEALAVFCGSVGVENLELSTFAHEFLAAYGSPNYISVESICFRARILARMITFGMYPVEEPEKARCVVLWGHNPDSSNMPLAKYLYKAVEDKNFKLIVIDPRRIPLAKRGLHLQVKPGTDLYLALATLNVIINEGLYDEEFVNKWTTGFENLREHVKKYPPEKAEEICGVPASDVKKFARIYASTKPACIVQGINTLDQTVNGIQNSRALAILQTITGNIQVPGGWTRVPRLRFGIKLSLIGKPMGADEYPLFYQIWGRTSAFGQAMLFPEMAITGKPYPIKALIVTGGNPALTMPESKKFREALEKLDLLVVMDLFMTETAELAHFVLPACSFLEKTGIAYDYGVCHGIPYVLLRKKAIEPVGESWPEWKFWTELGRRMGYQDKFPWNSDDDVVKYQLEGTGITLEDLKAKPSGFIFTAKEYGVKGFGTPSGKVEIYSKTLEEYGYDPLPTPRDSPYGIFGEAEISKDYPLILTTGARLIEYTHSQMRNIPQLRAREPDPIAEIHPSTAAEYGIADGETVIVETRKGSIKIKVKCSGDILPSVVSIPHGWAQANVNFLTDMDTRDPISGYPDLKALRCMIKKIS